MKETTIGLLNDSFPPVIDGVANAVVNYADIIEREYGKAIVATPHVPGADDSAYSFQVVRYPSIDTRKLIGYVTGYPFSPEVAHAMSHNDTKLLHTHCPITSALLARQLAESMNVPLVLTWHTKYDVDIANALKGKLLQEGAIQALIRNVNSCDEIWTVSEGAGKNLSSLGYKGDYLVMPNGVDLPFEKASDEMIKKASSGYDLPLGVPLFIFAGRLMWYKGIRIILDAIDALKDAGREFRMVFVGGGGEEDEIKAYAEKLGLPDICYFTGAVRDRELLRAWYTRADLLLFPSIFDTNGLVVREAAACSTATVMIEGSCAAEGVTDKQNGFLIKENPASLALRLGTLMDNPDMIRAVGENAGKELYISWEDSVKKAWERYQIVIDNYKSGKYPKRKLIESSFFKAQGELMESIGFLDAQARAKKEDLLSAILDYF